MDKYEQAQRLAELLEQAETAQEMKDIPNYEGLYAVTPSGQVWSYRNKIFLKHGYHEKGYHLVQLSKNGQSKTFRVHRLVAQAFIPNPDNLPQVGHWDDNKDNNDISNLYWTTNLENSLHNGKAQRICRKIICVETGEVFNSISEAAEKVNRAPGAFTHALYNPQRKCAGYHWQYV